VAGRGERWRTWLRVGVAAVVVLGAARGVAQESDRRWGLSYQAPEMCPDEARFRDIVASRVGRDPFTTDAEDRLDATLLQRGAAWRGRLVDRDARGEVRGERVLDAATCEELVASMAVAVSILADPLALLRGERDPDEAEAEPDEAESEEAEPEEPEPEEPEEAEPEEAEPEEAEPEEAEPGEDEPGEVEPGEVEPGERELAARVRPVVGLSFAAVWRLVPSTGLGASASAGLRVGGFSVALEGYVFGSVGADTADNERLQVLLAGAAVVGCGHRGWFLACLGLEGGAFRAEVPSLAVSTPVLSFLPAASLRLGVEVPLGDEIVLVALAHATLPIERTHLSVDDDRIWEAPPVAFGLRVGVTFGPGDRAP